MGPEWGQNGARMGPEWGQNGARKKRRRIKKGIIYFTPLVSDIFHNLTFQFH
jgi:hypothetical protein